MPAVSRPPNRQTQNLLPAAFERACPHLEAIEMIMTKTIAVRCNGFHRHTSGRQATSRLAKNAVNSPCQP
jgi:hypothetical protein